MSWLSWVRPPGGWGGEPLFFSRSRPDAVQTRETSRMSLLHFFRTPGLSRSRNRRLISRAAEILDPPLEELLTEACYNVECSGPLTDQELSTLTWLLAETFDPEGLGTESFLTGRGQVLEVGPRLNFTTAWSTNAVAICQACGLEKIRADRAIAAVLPGAGTSPGREGDAGLSRPGPRPHDGDAYPEPLESFETGMVPAEVFEIPVLQEGRAGPGDA